MFVCFYFPGAKPDSPTLRRSPTCNWWWGEEGFIPRPVTEEEYDRQQIRVVSSVENMGDV